MAKAKIKGYNPSKTYDPRVSVLTDKQIMHMLRSAAANQKALAFSAEEVTDLLRVCERGNRQRVLDEYRAQVRKYRAQIKEPKCTTE